MKRLIFFILLVGVGWYGYQHYPELLHRPPKHEGVVKNETGHTVERLRVAVAGQVFVRESLEHDDEFVFNFRTERDSPFQVVWEYADVPNSEFRWSGGNITIGPIPQRHVLTLLEEGGVTHQAQMKPAS